MSVAASPGSETSTTSTPKPAGDTTQTALQEFPSMAWMLSIPELSKILTDPKYNNATSNQIQAAIEATNWWKQTVPSLRTYTELNTLDPAAASQQVGQKAADVWDAYLKAGLTPDPNETSALALQAIQQNWTANQLNDAIVSHAATHPETVGQIGEIQTNTESMKQTAQSYGVTIDDATLRQWAIGIQAGEHNIADYGNQILQAAKNKFSYSPGITNALNSGVTTHDYFQPYAAEATKLLEKNVTPADFFDSPQWSKVTDYTDPTTNERREMTIPEMQQYVKSMDAWKSTQNGQQAASSMAQGIVSMFGKVSTSGSSNGFGAGN